MVEKWKECTLGDVITLKRGYDLPKKERNDGPYPIISSSGITGYHKRAKVIGPGVVTGRYGTLGEVFYIEEDFWPLNTSLYVQDFKGNDPHFVSYFLKTLKLGHQNIAGAVPGVNRNYLHMLKVRIPCISIQKKIASILSAYDDLIENNSRRIYILEEMARSIYRKWFVHFRFPGYESVRMLESEIGFIPNGWKATNLDYVLSQIESGSRPKGGIDLSELEIPSIGAENIIGLGKYDYSKDKFVSRFFFDSMKQGHIKNGDVLLYKDGAQIGRKSLVLDGFPHKTCCVNEHVFILRTNEHCTQNYLYFWLDQPRMTEKIKQLNTNAAQPGINQSSVKRLPIYFPKKDLLIEFEMVIGPILQLLFNLAKKNFYINTTRDLLLPKLISDEIDISNMIIYE